MCATSGVWGCIRWCCKIFLNVLNANKSKRKREEGQKRLCKASNTLQNVSLWSCCGCCCACVLVFIVGLLGVNLFKANYVRLHLKFSCVGARSTHPPRSLSVQQAKKKKKNQKTKTKSCRLPTRASTAGVCAEKRALCSSLMNK